MTLLVRFFDVRQEAANDGDFDAAQNIAVGGIKYRDAAGAFPGRHYLGAHRTEDEERTFKLKSKVLRGVYDR